MPWDYQVVEAAVEKACVVVVCAQVVVVCAQVVVT
jgi:hypothetical protein